MIYAFLTGTRWLWAWVMTVCWEDSDGNLAFAGWSIPYMDLKLCVAFINMCILLVKARASAFSSQFKPCLYFTRTWFRVCAWDTEWLGNSNLENLWQFVSKNGMICSQLQLGNGLFLCKRVDSDGRQSSNSFSISYLHGTVWCKSNLSIGQERYKP